MPLQVLDIRTARSTSSTLPTALKRPNMGINPQPPSEDAEEEEEDLFDFTPKSDVVMEDQSLATAVAAASATNTNPPDEGMEADTPSTLFETTVTALLPSATAATDKLQQPSRLFMVRSVTNNQSVPVLLENGATLLDLKRQLKNAYQLNPSTYTAFLGAQPLRPNTTLAEQGVSERCEILLHPATP